MATRRPRGNGLVLAVLRSPAHRLLSGMAIELHYTGRRSGREFTLPVQYARDGERLLVAVQDPATTWWRNFRTPQEVTVRLRGTVRHGTAQVVGPDAATWDRDRRLYEARWRRFAGRCPDRWSRSPCGHNNGPACFPPRTRALLGGSSSASEAAVQSTCGCSAAIPG